jgi:hypothetical protein
MAWAAIRIHRGQFRYADIVTSSEAPYGFVKSYVVLLLRAGFVRRMSDGVFLLIKNPGPRPPSVTHDGVPIDPNARRGLPDTFRQRLWTAARDHEAFDSDDLAGDAKTSRTNASWFVRALLRAALIERVAGAALGSFAQTHRYRLLKDLGPKCPKFDHDSGEVARE